MMLRNEVLSQVVHRNEYNVYHRKNIDIGSEGKILDLLLHVCLAQNHSTFSAYSSLK
jgi:hypothetical protein